MYPNSATSGYGTAVSGNGAYPLMQQGQSPFTGPKPLNSMLGFQQWATPRKDPMLATFPGQISFVQPGDIDCKPPKTGVTSKAVYQEYLDVKGGMKAAVSNPLWPEQPDINDIIEAKIREVELASTQVVPKPGKVDRRRLSLAVEGPIEQASHYGELAPATKPLITPPTAPKAMLMKLNTCNPPIAPKAMLKFNTYNINNNHHFHASRPTTLHYQSRRSSFTSNNTSPAGPSNSHPSSWFPCPAASSGATYNGKLVPTGPKNPTIRRGSRHPPGNMPGIYNHKPNNGFSGHRQPNHGFGAGENQQATMPSQNGNSGKRRRADSDGDMPSDVKVRQDVGPPQKRRAADRQIDDVYA
jgi:hypothetical protein